MKKRIWATLLAFCLIFSCAVGWERGAEAEAMDLYQGNVVTFGSYNGQPVEWYVLAFGYSDGSDEADLAFLLAKDTLCSYRFSTQEHPMWAGSDVNRFLNDELFYQLFSEEEQAWIGTGTFSDPASPYSIPGLPGESSSGKLILLSYYEARDLLPSQQARSASQDWWLRTSRDYEEYTHYVSADGQLREGSAIENELGVRPAMWVVMDNPTGTLQVVDDTVWNPYPEQEDDGVFGVGDYLQLGRYEQDGDTENGPEALRWKVLEINGATATLITPYCIDIQPYHNTPNEAVNWGQSSLRNWLNGEFMDTAFTDQEKSVLIQTGVENFDTDAAMNSNNYSYATPPIVSWDWVWILEASEASAYFPEKEDMLAYATDYAQQRGATTNCEGYGTWLLRTAKNDECRANIALPYRGTASVLATRTDSSIRPVICVDLVKCGIVEADPAEEAPQEEPAAPETTAEPGDPARAADWNNPYATVVSQGNSNPDNGANLTGDMLGQVLRMENQVGGWFRFVAPEDGDYAFSVLSPTLTGDAFNMNFSVNGESRATLRFEKSMEIQTQKLEGVHQGDVITWWDDDDTGRGYTLLDSYWLLITCQESAAAPEASIQLTDPGQETAGDDTGAGDGSWRTQRVNLDGAEISLVLPEGYFLLNSQTRELVRSDPKAYASATSLNGEDFIDAEGDHIIKLATGGIAVIFEFTPPSFPTPTQNDLYRMEDYLVESATEQMENSGYTNIECGLKRYGSGTIPYAGDNLFFYAFGEDSLFGTQGHFITVDSVGTAVEFWTYGMEREDVETMLGSFSFPVE